MTSEKICRTRQVDMSPEAIDQRMKDLSQLYKLGIAIQGARRLGKVKDLRHQEAERQRLDRRKES